MQEQDNLSPNEQTVVQGKILTNEQAYRKRKRKEREQQLSDLIQIAALGGSAFGLAVIANSNPQYAEIISKLPGANRYAKKHELAVNKSIANGVLSPTDLTQHFERQTFGRSILSMISTVEDLSPFGILKTLQTSNILEPYVGLDIDKSDVKIAGSALEANQDFYYNMILKASKEQERLTIDDMKNGFTIRQGKLYRNFEDGTIDDSKAILNHVKLVTSYGQYGESESPNRILTKFANTYDSSLGWNAFKKDQMAFIAGESAYDLNSRWAQAIFRQSIEIGLKTLDNPLGGVEDLLRAGGIGNTGFFESNVYKNIKGKLDLGLGPGGEYHGSIKSTLFKTGKNLTLASLGLYSSYAAIDGIIDFLTPDSSIWSEGVVAGVTHNYAEARIAAAKIFADPFQGYKEKQEYAADGSTSLLTLAGLPITGATFGASLPYFKRMFDSATKGVEQASNISDNAVHGYGIFNSITDKFNLPKTTLTKSFAMQGALIGGLAALPFLPGALIGKSSEELEKEYNGDQLVANRKGANWFTGSQHISGGEIQNFLPGRVARILADSKDEVRYNGDESLKRELDPILNPIGYLRNPYRFEEMHKHDMPYPVWGMDVNYGSFFGKLFQGTLGEIIKPTVVNPEFTKMIEETEAFNKQENVSAGLLRSLVVHPAKNIINTMSQGSSQNSDRVAGDVMSTVDANSLDQLSSNVAQRYFSDVDKKNQDVIEINYANEMSYRAIQQSTGSTKAFPIMYEAKPEERKLVESGMMLAKESPSVNQYEHSFHQTVAALSDFSGIKGFTGTLIGEKLGYDPDKMRTQLERSGVATSASRDFLDQNLGDIGGFGELQRRMLPTSSTSQIEYINPMKNQVAPDWLPQDKNRYYLDFSEGNFYDKVSNAEYRLPGKGYAAWNKELENIDPNDYPLVHQYRILSDVAPGSEQQISLRKKLFEFRAQGKMSKEEEDLFFQTLTQEQAKSRTKDFSEYKTSEERDNMSLGWKGLSSFWETVTHNAESPLEPLTPFRPGAKFIHKRTAIEDYEKAMLAGSDNSIWTSPYSHFIKPAANRLGEVTLPGLQIPEEARERDAFDSYFDKLEYMKARKNERMNDALRTTHGITYAGILNSDDYNKFKRSVSPDQQAYVDAFAKETNIENRERILSMLPTDIGRGYREIWKNLDVANEAKAKGQDVEEAVKRNFVSETSRSFGMVGPGGDLDEQVARARQIRMRAADQEAEHIVARTTGKPSEGWIGWDPRLSMEDVKLRTLTVGKEDYFKHGYWDSDVARNERIIALDNELEITKSYDEIVSKMRDDLYKKAQIESALNRHNMSAKRIILSDASENHFDMRID